MNLLDEVSDHRKNIKYEMVTVTLSELVRMFESEPIEIKIRPDFQRLFRWSRKQQSLLIESLMLEIPVPPLFCYENEEGIWELIDGLQRYSTILRFLKTKNTIPEECVGLNNNQADWHYDNANQLDTKLQLLEGDYLKYINGMTFDRLPIQLQRNIKRARLQVYVLKRETHKMYKYEVFRRLNRGGARLEDQEVRNCSVRLLSSNFADFLRELTGYSQFIEMLGISDNRLKQAFAEELILRYFAVKNNYKEFEHDVAPFLDKYMESVSSGQIVFDYDAERELFSKIVSILEKIEDKERIFRSRNSDRKPHGPFSSTIYESVMYGLAKNHSYLESLNGEQIETKIVDFILAAKDELFVGAGANTIKKLNGRINLAEKMLK